MSQFMNPENVRLIMGSVFFVVGLLPICAGLAILVFGPYRQEAKILAAQTARISQKALTDNIAAITQSATALVEAVNNLIKTSSGNAIVLIVVGAISEAAAYWLLIASA
jgi:hypothetical protein